MCMRVNNLCTNCMNLKEKWVEYKTSEMEYYEEYKKHYCFHEYHDVYDEMEFTCKYYRAWNKEKNKEED